MPSVPYTFAPHTLIQSAQVNANFAVLLQCLTASGGTLTGTFNTQSFFPTAANTYSIGSKSLPYANIVATALKLMDTDASNTLALEAGSDLSADRVLTITTGDADRTITFTADASIGGTNTGDQLVFKTISVAGQSDIVADSITDTLTIAAGTGITITTNAGTDTVTITSSAGTITGSTGATDNRVLRADGTGGATLQNSAATIDDSGNMTGVVDMKFGTLSAFTKTSKSVNSVIQAASDGFIAGTVDATAGGSSTGDISILSDSSNPPTTVVATCFGIDGKVVSCLAPVKKGDFYKVVTTTEGGTPSFSALWTSIGTAG